MMMSALPCCNSKKALSSINPLPLIQRFRQGWHKVVIAARGIVFNVMKTRVMWPALTSVTVLFVVLSIPVAASSSLFTFKSLISPSTNHSEIPVGVRRLSKLTHLDLSYSGFSGKIPLEILQLSKLVSLNLALNPLKLHKPGLKSIAEKLTNLEELIMSEVNISSM